MSRYMGEISIQILVADADPDGTPVNRKAFVSVESVATRGAYGFSVIAQHIYDRLLILRAAATSMEARESLDRALEDIRRARWEGVGRLCMSCDRWDRPADNVHAVYLMVEALRGIERWGANDAVSRAFLGFTALPETSWRNTLGVLPGEVLADAEARFRELSKTAHPDVAGGSQDRMSALTAAIATARKELGR